MPAGTGIETLSIDKNTAVVIWHRTGQLSHFDEDEAVEELSTFVQSVAPDAIVITLDEGDTLGTLSEEEMADLGWVRVAGPGGVKASDITDEAFLDAVRAAKRLRPEAMTSRWDVGYILTAARTSSLPSGKPTRHPGCGIRRCPTGPSPIMWCSRRLGR